jgi:hypothetical protein
VAARRRHGRDPRDPRIEAGDPDPILDALAAGRGEPGRQAASRERRRVRLVDPRRIDLDPVLDSTPGRGEPGRRAGSRERRRVRLSA